MRAIVHDHYGPPEVLHLADIDSPTAGAAELVVRVHSTTVNRTDCGFRGAVPFFVRVFSGLRRPRYPVLGTEFAGVVDQVGPGVTEYSAGDRVFGVNADRFGAHAELLRVPVGPLVAAMPDGVGMDEAAATCDGVVLANTGLTAAGVGAGQRVLVYGASGAIGSAAVQLALHLGAHVTAVCATNALDVIKALGPDELIDYTDVVVTALDERFDVVFDAVGKLSFRRCRRLLAPGGQYLTTDLGFLWHAPLVAFLTRFGRGRRSRLPLPAYRDGHVALARELLARGDYRPVIDRWYPLDEVPKATEYVETGTKVGNVVIRVVTDHR